MQPKPPHTAWTESDQPSQSSFVRELFLGRFRFDALESLDFEPPVRLDFWHFMANLRDLLQTEVDPEAIDHCGEYPAKVLDGLRALGAFGVTIPATYDGLGMTGPEYVRLMQLLGSHDANVTALISAHATLGVLPIVRSASDRLKRQVLPRCAAGAICSLALSEATIEPGPTHSANRASLVADGDHYVLDGTDLWCVNGILAELMVVIAHDPKADHYSACVVETGWPGVVIEPCSRFTGLRAVSNCRVDFRGVRVPRENLIGAVGDGLRVLRDTLDRARVTLPAAASGLVKVCAAIARASAKPTDEGDEDAEVLAWADSAGTSAPAGLANANVACSVLAIESVTQVIGALAEADGCEARLETIAAQQWTTPRTWTLIDDILQIRSGHGYVERALRDSRIGALLTGWGTNGHSLIARAAVDVHLDVAQAMISGYASWFERLRALPKLLGACARWYLGGLVSWARGSRYASYGRLGPHLRFAERRTRQLARALFRVVTARDQAIERHQAIVFRAVDVAMDLFVMSATILRAHRICEHKDRAGVLDLADAFAREARARIDEKFRAMRYNDDAARCEVGLEVLTGRCDWLAAGILTPGKDWALPSILPLTVRELEGRAPDVPVSRAANEWVPTQVWKGSRSSSDDRGRAPAALTLVDARPLGEDAVDALDDLDLEVIEERGDDDGAIRRNGHPCKLVTLVAALLTGGVACGGDLDLDEPHEFEIHVDNLTPSTSLYHSDVFEGPYGPKDLALLRPGDHAAFEIDASPEMRVQLVTMFAESNDAFMAFEPEGISLWTDAGEPVEGELAGELRLWDAGTEINEAPGGGQAQFPRQTEPGFGEQESGVVTKLVAAGEVIAMGPQGHVFPAPDRFASVTVEHLEDLRFLVTVTNVSPPDLLDEVPGPGRPALLSAGVWLVHDPGAEIFEPGTPASPELESLAEDADPTVLARALLDDRGVASGLSPVVWAVHDGDLRLYELNQPASAGLEALAEDGDPAALVDELMVSEFGLREFGVARATGGFDPGQRLTIRVRARPGDRLTLVTAYLAANDKIVSFGELGVPLFLEDGEPVTGDLGWALHLLDTGTELDEPIGYGPNQAPRQLEPGAGIDEDGLVRRVLGPWQGIDYPTGESIVGVGVDVDD